MTIMQFANRIIDDIKALPDEAKKRHDGAGPKTCWDEFKEQLQNEGEDTYFSLESNIRIMVSEYLSGLSCKHINTLFNFIQNTFLTKKEDEQIVEIVRATTDQIMYMAKCQKADYYEPPMKYVKWDVSGDTFVAKVLKQIDRDLFEIIEYPDGRASSGREDYLNFKHLIEENGLVAISYEEFEQELTAFADNRKVVQIEITNQHQDENKILNYTSEQSHPKANPENIAIIDAKQPPLKQIMQMTEKEETMRIMGAVMDLAKLMAKAQKKSIKAVLEEMKQELKTQKAKGELNRE